MVRRQIPRLFEIVGIRRDLHDPRNDVASGVGMRFHLPELGFGQFPGLVQHGVGHMDFPQVMQRRGADDFRDKLLRERVRVNAVALHLPHDDFRISRRFAHMVAGILVAALHEVGERHNQAVLHIGDGRGFIIGIGDIRHGIFGGFQNRPVEVLHFVAGTDVERPDSFHVLGAGRFAVIGE